MIRIRKIILLLGLLLSIVSEIYAQDAHVSQFYACPMLINPATTGMYKGNYKVFLQHRNQWKALMSRPFSTQVLAFDKPQEKYRYGAVLTNTKAGVGAMNEMNFLGSGAYEVTIDPSGVHNLITGDQLGVLYRSINLSNLTFENQFVTDGVGNGSFDQSIQGELLQNTSMVRIQSNAGVYYYHENVNSKYKPYLGISGFNLNAPKESFLGQKVRVPRRLVINGGTKFEYNENLSFQPMFLYMRQAKNNEFNIGALCYYFLKEQNVKIYGGSFFRLRDAVSLHLGALYKDYALCFSYDINTSTLKDLSHGRGAFELSFIYSKQNYKYVPSF